ncbi:MAG: peptidoglycan-binding domain-containing protein [Pseudomonadota bacterium]
MARLHAETPFQPTVTQLGMMRVPRELTRMRLRYAGMPAQAAAGKSFSPPRMPRSSDPAPVSAQQAGAVANTNVYLSEAVTWRRAEDDLALSRNDARGVQRFLRAAGYTVGGVDGILGERSRSALAEWQERHGRRPTGYLNADQAKLMLSHPTARPPKQTARTQTAAATEETVASTSISIAPTREEQVYACSSMPEATGKTLTDLRQRTGPALACAGQELRELFGMN